MRSTWPGNIAELPTVLDDLVRAFPGRTRRQANMPTDQRAPCRTATLSESAERRGIITTLQPGGGRTPDRTHHP